MSKKVFRDPGFGEEEAAEMKSAGGAASSIACCGFAV
jgi:hypothetical protein